MSFADKFANKAQELRGRFKRDIGDATGDRELRDEGRADDVKGNMKQAGEKIKDAVRGLGGRRRPRQY